MKDRLNEALKKATADYAEIRFEDNDATALAYRGEEIDSAVSAKRSGGIVRACTRGGWGLAVFDSLDDLDHQVAEACRCAELVGCEKTELADVPPIDETRQAEMKRDPRGVSMDDKIKLIGRYNKQILQTDPAIETTNVVYQESFRRVHFASTRGTYFMEERPLVKVVLLAMARKDSLIQRAHFGISSAETYDVAEGLEDKADEIARRAVALLTAPPCPGGKHTVILNQELGGVFVHEAFGHLSEADFLYENPKMRELMHVGRKIGVERLNVVDDGSRGRLVGTHSFDDEGTPTGKTDLIRDGVLVGHLHSLETAAKMDASPTGNARAIGREYSPIVRMTNTYIDNGDQSFDDLIAGIDDGIYACGMLGGQTMMEMFTFSAAYGRRIENGKLGELVRDVTLTGNVFETLNSIDGFGDDLKIIEGSGGCGKGGQWPCPVTFGSPHLRIQDVVIGGA